MHLGKRHEEKHVRLQVATCQSYTVHVGSGLLEAAGAILEEDMQATEGLVITCETVSRLWLDSLLRGLSGRRLHTVVVRDGEQHKTLDTVSRIYDEMVDARYSRDSVVYALGGGVVGDTAGFAAATYMRGVRYAQLPTTLLAQVDASVGGKVAVNHAGGKNLIGSFHQPTAVICDVSTLHTLPSAVFADGLAEVLKTAVIAGEHLLGFLEGNANAIMHRDQEVLTHMIAECIRVKAGIVAQDERDTGQRMLLNLGHTFGHALEASSGYGSLSHGRAVAVGLCMAIRLSALLGHDMGELEVRVRHLLGVFGLPHHIIDACPDTSMDKAMGRLLMDKKRRTEHLRFVVPRSLGDVIIADQVPGDLVARVFRESLEGGAA